MQEELLSFGKTVAKSKDLALKVSEDNIDAGFPAFNSGNVDQSLDVNDFLIDHPNSSYIYKVRGESMIDLGIMPGDFVIVDSAKRVQNHDIVVACIDNEFTIKEIVLSNPPQLIAHNKEYSNIKINENSELKIIGPVVGVVRKYK